MPSHKVGAFPPSLSNPEFRALLDTVPDAVLVVDEDGRIVLANEHTERLFGYEPDALIGESVDRLVPDRIASDHARHRRAFFRAPSVRPMGARGNLKARHRDGTVFPVEIRLSPLPTEDGTFVSASVRDVSEHRRIEALQDWQTEFSSALIDSLPGIFYLVDTAGRIRQWNHNLEAATGYTPAEIECLHPRDFFEAKERPRIEAAMRAVFEEGRVSVDAPLRARDGTLRDYHFIGRRITLADEDFLTGLGIDVTRVRRTEAALEYLSGLQRVLVEASKRFIASDASDLDELITEVLGLVGAYCDVDRSYLFRFKDGRELMDNTHEWCAPGITPEIENLQDLPREAVPRVVELMERREVMHVPRVADLPREWENDRAVFEEEDIRSLVVVPIVVSGELHGFVGFDSVRRERAWDDEEIRLLEVLADLFGAVIQRETQERALRESESLRSQAEELAHLGSWELYLDTDRFLASPEWQRVTGCRSRELTEAEVFDLAHPDDRGLMRQCVDRTLATGEPYDVEHRIIRPDNGEVLWVRVNAELDGEPGKARRVYGFAQDITEQKRIEAAIAESEARYRSVVDNIREVVFQSDEQGNWTFLNPAWEEITGFPVEQAIGQRFDQFVHPEDRPACEHEFRKLRRGDKQVSRMEARFLTRRGNSRWLEVNTRVTVDVNGRVTGASGTLRDVTEQREAEQKMFQLAHYDTVTDLPNRILALDRLEQLLKATRRTDERVAVLFLDLDHFKKANDTLGHESGDRLLREAARRLLAEVREEDTVARFGGDEFLILLGGLKHAAEAQPVTEKLLETFREPFHLEGRELMLTASVGIAVAPDDGTDSQDLLRNADMAMYESKTEGRNTYHYFTRAMNREVERRLAVEEQLRGALNRGELSLVYQPFVEVATGHTVGAEALLRWLNPALGEVGPDEFIPIAEQTGLIDDIGHFVLREALQRAAQWRRNSRPGFRVAVNVSPQQFRDTRLVQRIRESLVEADLPGEALQLEVTESVLLSGRSQTGEALASIKALGVDIVMDDFGTGYASLSYLRHFPFDTLKIDRSFVGDITDDPRDCDLVIASLALAHSLKLNVIAEGVETEAQLAVLRQHGCELAQGFLFSRPLDANALTRKLEA